MKRFFLVFGLMAASACFGGGIEKTGSVVNYRKGVVKTYGGGAFALGPLSADWRSQNIKERAVLFQNAHDGSTITVSSWCKSAFDDAPLPTLSDQLLVGLRNLERLDEQTVAIDGHTALRSSVRGQSEGDSVFLRAYVLKTNQCVFDFLYVATPDAFPSAADFDQMVGGFHVLKDPKSL